MSTAEAGPIPCDREPERVFSDSVAVNRLNLIRDEDWGWGATSKHIGEVSLRRIGEDIIALRLLKAGKAVLIVGNWDETENFSEGIRRVRRGKWKLPTQTFNEVNADDSTGLVCDLEIIQGIRANDQVEEAARHEAVREAALLGVRTPRKTLYSQVVSTLDV